MSCGLAAVLMLLHDRTGCCLAEATLRTESAARGHPPGYDAINGTYVQDVPTMLAEHGSPGAAAVDFDGTAAAGRIQAETAKHSTIVLLQSPGHFVVVDGFRTDVAGKQFMQIRDPALPGAAGCREIEVGGAEWNDRLGTGSWMITQ